MTSKFPHFFFRLLISLALLAGTPFFTSAPSAFSPDSLPRRIDQTVRSAEPAVRRMLVDHRYPQSVQWAQEAAGIKRVDYGVFSLWEFPSERVRQGVERMPANSLVRAGLQDMPSTIRLRQYTLSTFGNQRVEPALEPALSQPGSDGFQFWMVQFIGPVKTEWVNALTAEGLQIVAYIPDNAYVVWGRQPVQALRSLPASVAELVQWTGAYHPAYRLAPALLKQVKPDASDAPSPLTESVSVTVQLFTTPAVEESLERLLKLALAVHRPPYPAGTFTAVSLQLPRGKLQEAAAFPDVFNIEPWNPPVKLDEVQGQILAGNITRSEGKAAPSSPGYLTFLVDHNFPTNPNAYPLVDVVDDGLDIGDENNVLHPDFHLFGRLQNPDRISYINNCTSDPSGNSLDGHGNINVSIAGGYNYLSGFPYADPAGYQLGLGISPFGRFAATKIFKNGGSFNLSKCSNSYAAFVQTAYTNGARITSNSWGDNSGFGQYTIDAFEFDLLTRDASAAAGNQEMLHIFAAGNSGQLGMRTINTPGTAKNILSVGATENVRDNGTQDGCGLVSADNADDLASFSSRGPTADGRIKPDIMAPGVHIQGAASQDPNYNGSGVCGGVNSRYYPANQTLYTWSSGTSHSTPAIAGVAQLTYEYFQRVFKPGVPPSPAMIKALMVNTPRYLDGAGTGGNLPGPQQGWGDPNMGLMFDNTARILKDQTHLFTESGQEYVIYGDIPDPSRPFHVSLVWTDAPGAPTGAAYVNNLNLEVIAGGQIYKGNVFSGAVSKPGGSFDERNNIENVFVPAGASGSFRVRVIAANIAGDGLPGNASPLDQDFALVIYNGVETTSAPVLLLNTGVSFSDSLGNNNGVIDMGESITVQVELKNIGVEAAVNITTTASPLSGKILMGAATQAAYPDLPAGGLTSATSSPPYDVQVLLTQPCGGEFWLLQEVTYNGAQKANLLVGPFVTGLQTTTTYTAGGLPKAIPDRDFEGLKVVFDIPEAAFVRDIDVRVNISHPFTSDLGISLISPGGREIALSVGNGGSGDHYTDTIFDEEADLWIFNGKAPFTGRYKPEESLLPLYGSFANGAWKLRVIDYQLYDVGTFNSASIDLRSAACQYFGIPYFVPALIIEP